MAWLVTGGGVLMIALLCKGAF
ncbi:hypothetical protein CGLO_13767 [Colletotrichum gloeosporioides Cg-14]|uniref:Uncharacterized protein n=1 Tax=Colletotrichum gloeosporioides (strain Cg-14) TaxID=1237896 RepID=T0LFT4_COLGC|nr:hypothetical protein CGLO_13767 [Colletotrichum gloeosporioides Cg-14]